MAKAAYAKKLPFRPCFLCSYKKRKDATWCRILSFLSIVRVVVSIPLQLGIAL